MLKTKVNSTNSCNTVNIISEINKCYTSQDSDKKINLLSQQIERCRETKKYTIKLFKRYLLTFRIRMVYKSTLYALHDMANESNNTNLLNALKNADLLKYIPPQFSTSANLNVFLQLQCFRGVLSKKDMIILSEKRSTNWEAIASNISMIAKQFNSPLFKALQNKILFIKNDTVKLLNALKRYPRQISEQRCSSH